ncbi:M20 family metallopeptidase [Hoeflea sp. YIM 152468]|uniref:M20 aminoacylase family protein n=1 Tax=Hoeflea sp. YIM 152468 TaxID=3031759 RepID=UPI0023DB6E8B|nr:M20 aminoacylase family protein [Hoeflea sp. YIM 152468]MDF1608083.1 M20 family metallopeptidase [Hoeflea sp. YIM 152468]
MQLVDDVVSMKDEVATWRRTLHAAPELLYDVHNTAAFVAEKLKSFGCDEVVTGIGRTGVVGLIHGRPGGNGPAIGLRADMDALPIDEISGVPWASRTPGKMHACGHDGHTAMLLGAARHLAATRNFTGSVAVIFQPAEEGGAGGREMVKDGMMERFGIAKVFGMHNLPGLPVGQFAIRKGAIMAATDIFDITIKGRGGHAAMPYQTVDPIVAAAAVVSSLQSIASRNANPLEPLVVSVTKFIGGSAYNIIPETVELAGTVRTLSAGMRDMAETRIGEIVRDVAAAHGAEGSLNYLRNYPLTFNHSDETDFAADIAEAVAGEGMVERNQPPTMGGEDFSFMLEARPGAFIFMGNGDTAGLHHPAYDFNDDAIPVGISYWVKLAEKALAA